VTEETVSTLQWIFGIDKTTVWEWFEFVKQAYPQMVEFHPQFLLISMGAIESAFQYNWPIERWIAETRKSNGVA
jgi:hypothetical protein